VVTESPNPYTTEGAGNVKPKKRPRPTPAELTARQELAEKVMRWVVEQMVVIATAREARAKCPMHDVQELREKLETLNRS
jgi:hypothetical protein